jgi:hypothetical protein
MAAIRQLWAVRHANGVRARTPWNNEQLVKLLPPYMTAFSLSWNTPDTRKALRDSGTATPTAPYLVCTTIEGGRWTYVHATPQEIACDDLIDRPDNGFVVHMWADASSQTTQFRMHKRGKQVVDVCMRGTDSENPTDLIRFDATAVGPGWLKYCPTLGDAMGELLNQVGINIDQTPALVAENSTMRLTCDPADIDSVTLIHLRQWNPELDE